MGDNSILSYRDVIKLFGSINLNVSSENDLWNQLVRKFDATGLCRAIGVGRIEIDVEIESGVFDIDGNDEYFTYDLGEPVNEDEPLRGTYTSVNGGIGKVVAYPVAGYTFTGDDKEVLYSLGNIISLLMARVRLSSNVEKTHYVDMMTGLYNTPGMIMEGKKLEAVGELFDMAIIFMNLRDFTGINKRISMKKGDEVMKRFAKLLNTLVSMNRGVAARLGGDKFLLIIPKSQLDTALTILSSVQEDIQILDHTEHIEIRAWIGVCRAKETDTFDEVMDGASAACEKAHAIGADEPVFAE